MSGLLRVGPFVARASAEVVEQDVFTIDTE
jgi:hypothetical protein